MATKEQIVAMLQEKTDAVLNELSKSTLGSYIKKASKDADAADDKAKESEELDESEVHMGKFMKTYKDNEENNHHSENVKHLAKHFGSEEDKKEVDDIHKRHMKNGSIKSDDYKRRSEIHNTLWPKAKAAHDEWKKKQ